MDTGELLQIILALIFIILILILIFLIIGPKVGLNLSVIAQNGIP
ncbi:hypothetical protein MJ1_0043 [Nanobdella aerobiophila]|uniref:Uncharacterized protein n=1 Tax=Nanobdella aerobiophila TaxID=2586965 RepID=A0A915WSI0_9ARCH|nr:hypothetical protein [Nanobdella aerobiophila]BBL45222.1 hypothetical protein MJ1_0043 [Nanobdella aerobiophila]